MPDASPPSRQTAPLVSFRHVVKRFGPLLALDGISLDIAEGEFFSLLGPSGCGKTTLMRMLAGFETPDSGEVLLDGRDLAGVPPHRRPVNMMFQSYALFPHMSVAANIGFGLVEKGVGRAERDRQVGEMLRLVRLEGAGNRRPDELSGGQRQRVALARALVLKPRLLLLDEPMAALDRKLREETQRELKRIQADLGTTFVVVTHDQDEAMALSDRVAVLSAGRIRQVGPPAEVYERPADRFVAGFVGQASFLACEVLEGANGLWTVRHLATGIPLRCRSARDCQAGERLSIMVRPERLSLGEGEEAHAEINMLRGVLRDVTYRGDHAVSAVDLPGGEEITVSLDGRAAGGLGRPGARVPVTVRFLPEDAVLLAEEGT